MPRVVVWAHKVPPGPHPLADMDSSLTVASPVITRHPSMLQLGGLTPAPHLYSWVDWSNVSKVSCSRNNNNTKVATSGIEPTTFQLESWCPDHLVTQAHHTSTHAHAHTTHKTAHTCKHTNTHTSTHRHTHTLHAHYTDTDIQTHTTQTQTRTLHTHTHLLHRHAHYTDTQTHTACTCKHTSTCTYTQM